MFGDDDNYLEFIIDIETRWNTTFSMVKRLLLLTDPYNKLCVELKRQGASLDATKIEQLTKVMEFLNPFQDLTLRLDSSK